MFFNKAVLLVRWAYTVAIAALIAYVPQLIQSLKLMYNSVLNSSCAAHCLVL
jgi:hypothetical protein